MTMINIPQSVFASNASPRVSKNYVHISSNDIVRLMKEEGWELAAATGTKTRTRDPLYTGHMLDFRRPDEPVQMDGVVPRIIFLNAHDGTRAASATAGFFRFICSNGLVIGNSVAHVRARHSGVDAKEFVHDAQALTGVIKEQAEKFERWGKLKLTERQRTEYARLACKLRYGDSEAYSEVQLLRPRREEDDHGTLLTVYNRTQENCTKGGLAGVSRGGRRIKSRAIGSINLDMSFNSRLWQMTEELGEIWS